jgi:hypothetical protein
MTLGITTAWGQPKQVEPHIGYLYPSGGRQGSVFQVLVGGQFLRGVNHVYLSGEGVRASVVQHFRPLINLDGDQRRELLRQLKELTQKRLAELPGPEAQRFQNLFGAGLGRLGGANVQADKPAEPVKLPEHPLLQNLENKSLRELLHVASEFLNFRKRQPNVQIAETVRIEVSIDPGAAPGDRELRLGTPLGLTNPLCFQVGLLPETCEQEPNDPQSFPWLPKEPPLALPILLNGQIKPGDVDRFRFQAQQGQQLVIETQARHLIPYLADAVPGWFQATLALYDGQGHEVAFADDYRFDPDPVLLYQIPQAGLYELEIRDSVYRGREDFVYRIAMGEQPFITAMFPLGGQIGLPAMAVIDGWNLPGKLLLLDTQPGPDGLRQTAWNQDGRLSNRVTYAVDTGPEGSEEEPNDTLQNAQSVAVPQIVNGRIAQPGDVDVFQFEGRAGEEVVAEVVGRRLRSPLDSLLRLMDEAGQVLAWNDDYDDKEGFLHREMGSLTHYADSYLRARLPQDGTYYVHLSEAQHQGGAAYGYRLRLTPPQPDFALRVAPSSLNVRAGGAVPVWVHALRKDGFDGAIDLQLKDAPPGFRLHGGRIPAGRGSIRVTLSASGMPFGQPAALHLEGRAAIGDQTVTRLAVPCEDSMQAFLYRHLIPSQQLLVAVLGGRFRPPPLELAEGGPLRIPANGTAQVRVRTGRLPRMGEIKLELQDPPKGLTLQDVTAGPGGLTFQLKADGSAMEVGFADNLIVEALTEVMGGKPGDPATQKKQRVSLGVLPAIPFEIVPG